MGRSRRQMGIGGRRGIVPDALTGPLRGIAKLGARQLRRKYGEGQVVELEAGLEQLRATLDGRDYLLDEFSYADIAMAVVFEFVEPSAHVRRGVAERRAWSDARLAARYADLVEWRAELRARRGYLRHPCRAHSWARHSTRSK